MGFLRFLIHQYKWVGDSEYRQGYKFEAEFQRIRRLPRYVSGHTELLGHSLEYLDGPSFHFTYKEIFREKIYDFETNARHPYIIDAGANIGLSIIRFKQLYPQCSIVAFEPDRNVFKVLKNNVTAFGLDDVELINKAVWNEDTTIRFLSEGADAGRIPNALDTGNLVEVAAVSLRPYIQGRNVDLLKIDIEGAELTVLKHCADLLPNVERLFVEYHSFVKESQNLQEILAILTNSGFRYSISSPGLASKSPFLKLETYLGMDMQLNIYAFRN